MRTTLLAVALFSTSALAGAAPGLTFLGRPIGDGSEDAAARELVTLGERIAQPLAVPRTRDRDAFMKWLDGAYRARLDRDERDRNTLADLAERIGAKHEPLITVVLAHVLDAQWRQAETANAADPLAKVSASGGIGIDDGARRAAPVARAARNCAKQAAGKPGLAAWAIECARLATEYERRIDTRCAQARALGLAQPGTFCGDRAAK